MLGVGVEVGRMDPAFLGFFPGSFLWAETYLAQVCLLSWPLMWYLDNNEVSEMQVAEE